jgi:Tol biopolymer transport system component
MVAGSDMQPVQVTHEGPADPIPLLTLGRCSELPSWSPDSSKLVFDDMHQIWVISADGSNRRRSRALGITSSVCRSGPRPNPYEDMVRAQHVKALLG